MGRNPNRADRSWQAEAITREAWKADRVSIVHHSAAGTMRLEHGNAGYLMDIATHVTSGAFHLGSIRQNEVEIAFLTEWLVRTDGRPEMR
jgi:hypothetical protein